MAIAISIVMGLAALAYVFYPLVYRNWQKISVTTDEPKEPMKEKQGALSLEEKEQRARSALHEIELDYQLGNLAEEDYRLLRERSMQTALDARKERHGEKRDQELDEEIEVRLRTMREKYAEEQT